MNIRMLITALMLIAVAALYIADARMQYEHEQEWTQFQK